MGMVPMLGLRRSCHPQGAGWESGAAIALAVGEGVQ